jgi:cytidine deaminase
MAIAPEDVARLQVAARAALEHAYCPYSRFPVGAAALGESGIIYEGCNVENASFGLTVCAERNALFHGVACGERRFLAVALFTRTPAPAAPCGACRQVILELAPEAFIYSFCDGEPARCYRLEELLPHPFDLPDRL